MTKNMEVKKFAMIFVAFFALAVLSLSSVSAEFANIDSVNVNGIEAFGTGGSQTAGVFAGDTFPVRVVFTAGQDANDTRVVARLLGDNGLSQVTERFDVLAGNTYSRLLNIKLPSNIDPSESYTLEISIENNENGLGARKEVTLEVQRSNYQVQILSVDADTQVKAGKVLALDVVVKNTGRHLAEDTYVTATIPELGISRTVYFRDLSAQDQSDPDRQDSENQKIYLTIPSNAPAGVYTIQLQAFNSDSSTVATKKVVVLGSEEDNGVYTSGTSQTFAVGQSQTYSVVLVNSGDSIKVYDLIPEVPSGLNVVLDESVVAVPAGSSRTVKATVSASKEGTYDFAINVKPKDGSAVDRQSFTAQVQGTSGVAAGSAAVLLTVVLAVIFVVLVVVLIVLLTRKPQKSEEFGESYY